ncbi:MAG: D-alanyl-D-alanine carboxypeptidase/D-alanyl-D-alanine-endopeptidase [Planctomycetota bacterium]|nr:D-alanyl-D-alanine carboxypeptidase/D-alanyl-D-alanine-endopeptidase [Planctomycetota bacterium]
MKAASLLCFLCFASTVASADPEQRIKEILSKLPSSAKNSILISSVNNNGVQKLYEKNPDSVLRPASNMKLLTLALALEKLGPSYKHTTQLKAAGIIAKNALQGDLHIIGKGDPNLSRRFQNPKDRSQDIPILSQWSRALVRRGIRRIDGDIVADDRFFDQDRYHKDWERGDRPYWYASEVSALMLNDGCVDIEISPAKGGGLVRLFPPTKYLNLKNQLKATASAKAHVFSVQRSGTSRDLLVRGKFWTKANTKKTEITVPDPALFFATAMKESLERAGIKVSGAARRVRGNENARGEELAIQSTPLPLTLAICGKRSLNHYAEALLKTVAKEKTGQGSYEAGTKQTRSFLKSKGINCSKLVLRDGSGLSRKNQISARAVHDLLVAMHKSKNASIYKSSLTVGGVDGTLRRRFKKLPRGCRVEAKTGTLRDTSALSGYLTKTDNAGNETVYVFSIIMNNFSPSLARRAQDNIVMSLCK